MTMTNGNAARSKCNRHPEVRALASLEGWKRQKCPRPILRDAAKWPFLWMTVVWVEGFAISLLRCYGKPMFSRRTIPISGPASA